MYKAVVWKDGWLAHSETFIRDQMFAMQDWEFLKLGLFRLDNPLLEPDFAPFGNNLRSKITRKVVGVRSNLKEFQRKIQEVNPQLIHAHFLSGGMNAIRIADTVDLPLITTLHNPRLSFEQSGLPFYYRSIYRRNLTKLLESGSSFIAVSNYVADAAVNIGIPSNRIEILPIGTGIVPKIVEQDRNGIIFVGRLIEIKGILDLLQAIAILPTDLRRTPLTIVGDGILRDEIEKRAKELRLNVNTVGWKSSDEIPEILSKHELFCAPSKSSHSGSQEGFGMVYLEAALQELPCVAYASGGVVDAIEDGRTGRLVKEGDINALSEALADLLTYPSEARRLGLNGRDRVKKNFDIVQQAKELEQIYLSIIQ